MFESLSGGYEVDDGKQHCVHHIGRCDLQVRHHEGWS